MQRHKDLALLHGLLLAAFLAAIPVAWVELRNAQGPWGVIPVPVEVSGLRGTITLGSRWAVPIWLLLLISIAAAGICVTNALRFTAIPRLAVAAVLFFSGIHYAVLFALFFQSQNVAIMGGPIIAMTATVIGLISLLIPTRKADHRARFQIQCSQASSLASARRWASERSQAS